MKNGWHKILGYDVYIENNKVLRGTLGEGSTYRTAYPYKWDKTHRCWIKNVDVSVNSFRNGVKRESVIMA